MLNGTIVTEFVLQGFFDIRELQILHFVLFLTIYLAALLGNFLIILIVVQSSNLHSPMYFFLANLSFLDACYISTTVPKSMAVSFTNDNLISFSGCVSQVFVVITCAGAELSLLTLMAYDRYIAICFPLQYGMIMNLKTCLQMAAAAWVCSLVYAMVHTASTFRLRFCWSNVIHQFFCDIPQLLSISCTDIEVNLVLILTSIFILGLFCFVSILVSYGYIFSAVFKMQSVQSRQKAFSTCIPHLSVVCLFTFTSAFCYLKPKSWSSPTVDLLAAFLYTVLPPLLNPIIYNLRNKEIQGALLKVSKKRFGFHMMIS